MPLFASITTLGDVEEFHVDSTYKTNRTGHELFAVVATVNGIGFPIAYFLLKMNPINTPVTRSTTTTTATATATTTNTTTTTTPTTADVPSTPPAVNPTNEQLSTRSDLISQFFTKLRERGLRSVRFMFTDKDEGQINAIANVFGEEAVRLCLWHLMRAVKLQLAKNKLEDPQYDVEEAMRRFTFVERSFQPTENREGRRCERADHREIIVAMMRRHYDMHSNIPVGGGNLKNIKIYEQIYSINN